MGKFFSRSWHQAYDRLSKECANIYSSDLNCLLLVV